MEAPYYAVIFTSSLSDITEGYEVMAERMVDLAKEQDGFLGIESARETIGITVSYWKDLNAIQKWKQHLEHLSAQAKSQSVWYTKYTIRIALVERQYSFEK